MAQEFKKFMIFLKALEAGLEVDIDGEKFALGYDEKGNPKVSSKHYQKRWIEGKMKEEVVYIENMALQPINEFIRYINKQLDEEDIALLVSNITINKSNG